MYRETAIKDPLSLMEENDAPIRGWGGGVGGQRDGREEKGCCEERMLLYILGLLGGGRMKWLSV